MIKRILDWLGIEIRIDEKACTTCEQLTDLLDYERLRAMESIEFERMRNKELLLTLTELVKPRPAVIEDNKVYNPILSRHAPFSARRAVLERESQAKADEIRRSSPVIARDIRELKQPIVHMATSVEQLEEELSISGE